MQGSRIAAMKKSFTVAIAVAVLSAAVVAQDRVDFAVIEKIRAEGMERSKILETFDYLVTTIGPRLTNSPAHRRAVQWSQDQMKAMGLAEVHTEGFQFGRGWTLNKVSIEMIEPRYVPMIGYPKGWSPSTAGRQGPRRRSPRSTSCLPGSRGRRRTPHPTGRPMSECHRPHCPCRTSASPTR